MTNLEQVNEVMPVFSHYVAQSVRFWIVLAFRYIYVVEAVRRELDSWC